MRRPLTSRAYQIGTAILVLISLTPFLPWIDSSYTQTYYLDEQRHEIPWQYSPSGGRNDQSGTSFRVRVALPDMAKNYEALSRTITVGKALEFSGDALSEMCVTRSRSMICEWPRGAYVYSASGDVDMFPQDVSDMMTSVADLLDGFEVPGI